MGDVDIANQLRAYYKTQRIHFKTWKPLWHFLIDTVIVNSYRLSSYHDRTGYKYSHKQFRMDLRDQFFKRSAQRPRTRSTLPHKPPNIIWAPVAKHKQVELDGKQHVCAACSEAQRESEVPYFGRRKPLADLSVNTTMRSRDGDWQRRKRPPRTLYGCSVCEIPLCATARCWESHIECLSCRG